MSLTSRRSHKVVRRARRHHRGSQYPESRLDFTRLPNNNKMMMIHHYMSIYGTPMQVEWQRERFQYHNDLPLRRLRSTW